MKAKCPRKGQLLASYPGQAAVWHAVIASFVHVTLVPHHWFSWLIFFWANGTARSSSPLAISIGEITSMNSIHWAEYLCRRYDYGWLTSPTFSTSLAANFFSSCSKTDGNFAIVELQVTCLFLELSEQWKRVNLIQNDTISLIGTFLHIWRSSLCI